MIDLTILLKVRGPLGLTFFSLKLIVLDLMKKRVIMLDLLFQQKIWDFLKTRFYLYFMGLFEDKILFRCLYGFCLSSLVKESSKLLFEAFESIFSSFTKIYILSFNDLNIALWESTKSFISLLKKVCLFFLGNQFRTSLFVSNLYI